MEAAPLNEASYEISGLTCPTCVGTIERILRARTGDRGQKVFTNVSVIWSSGADTATLKLNSNADLENIATAARDAFTGEPDLKKFTFEPEHSCVVCCTM